MDAIDIKIIPEMYFTLFLVMSSSVDASQKCFKFIDMYMLHQLCSELYLALHFPQCLEL